MFASIRTARSTKTSIIAAAAVAAAALVGELALLDRQVAAPYAEAMTALARPHFEETITVRAPVTTHFASIR